MKSLPITLLAAAAAFLASGASTASAAQRNLTPPVQNYYYCPAGLINTGGNDALSNGSNCSYWLGASFPEGGTSDPSLNSVQIPSLDVLPVWQTTQGAGVTVAVLDTGIDPANADLAPNLLPGWNFFSNNANSSDQFGHGTMVASIIGAAAGQGGYVGIAPKAKILDVKIMGGANGDTWSDKAVVKGIYYAIAHHASVINCSFGSFDLPVPGLAAAMQAAQKANAVVVISAGNNGANLDRNGNYELPSGRGLANAITVANLNTQGRLSPESNYGVGNVQVAAPGDFLYGDFPNSSSGGYLGGTSAAAAATSGVAALLRSAYPNASAAQIVKALVEGSTPLASLRGKVASGGVVSATGSLAFLAAYGAV